MHVKFLVLVLLAAFTKDAYSQVNWKFSAKKIGDKTFEIHLKATVDEPWHIYSQSSPKGGPLPTSITFSKNPLVVFQGKPKEEGEMEIEHSEVFGIDVYSYKDSVDFVQIVKLKNKVKTTVAGNVEFMACTDQQCLSPQKVSFSVKVE